MTVEDRTHLVERVAKIITGRDHQGRDDDQTWREWTEEAEQIVDLLHPEPATADQS
jgi:hypothetical protein